MNEENKIRNPSVTLYPFHLRDDFDLGFQSTAQNVSQLWDNLADNIGKQLKITELESIRNHLICYENGIYKQETGQSNYQVLTPDSNTLPFQAISLPHNLILNGSILPLRIHDTYAADLTLSYQNLTVTLDKLKQLNPNGCLLPNQIQASLGQTILLYAEPVVYDGYRNLADECLKAFLPDKMPSAPKLIAEGTLFGSPIFEYDNRNINPAQRCHVLVWLKSHPDTLKLATTNFNYYLLNLLCSRAKIVFAYQKSREWYREGQRIASEIETEIPAFAQIEKEPDPENRLRQLKELLARIRTKVFQYTGCLRNLREYHNTIVNNAENYGEALTGIQSLSLEGDNLEFWQKFLDLAENKYQQQIKADLGYLFPSQELFREMISTIRGMVQIEQVESDRKWQDDENRRDRKLQDIIFFVGTAIAAGGIFCTSYALTTTVPIKWKIDPSLPIHPFVWSIFWSIIFGFALGALIWGILVVLRKLFK
ncbi:DUF3270 domain-containing protein [Argonema antarcticum]|uniref:DUF3270 domain-containing protein n=1 Tax=Argonema antarcticum TaxID=2942763 RepID=UPI00201186C2|nr:DUF3270 domain-containing protein [Argonema antarcticum]MCL1469484.1 DUF3270 domain-containing protein [Argonema antarcticum A004/B2]